MPVRSNFARTSGFPVGQIIDFAGQVIPGGWILCDGSSLFTDLYPQLFAVIGYTFGGSGPNFSLPNYSGLALVGRDNMGGGTANRITSVNLHDGLSTSAVGGEASALLTPNMLPIHQHDQGLSTISSGMPHTHSIDYRNVGNYYDSWNGSGNLPGGSSTPLIIAWETKEDRDCNGLGFDCWYYYYTARGTDTAPAKTTQPALSHTHVVPVDNAGQVNAKHPNQQPTLILHKIIRYD